MKRISVLLIIIVTFFTKTTFAEASDTLVLKAKPVYGKEAKMIARILTDYHYRKLPFNDSLSSAILDSYLKQLDNNKSYFLASDIKGFEKYRYTLDDMTRNENVDAAYDIYDVFRHRYQERMNYVMNVLVKQSFDFTANEFYETERDNEPWAKDDNELNDIWRKVIKSQVLSLKLANKKPEDFNAQVAKRYERFIKTFSQFNSEDVFGIYMNCITEAYDPHTNYMSPVDADKFNVQMSLSLEGIGAQLQPENDYTKVARIIPGGPAEKSDKIHNNDFIIGVGQGVDGEMVNVVGWRLDDVVKLIKGPKGTSVRIQFLPAKAGVNGPPVEITLVRDKIKLKDQEAKKKIIEYEENGKDKKLGVITLPGFYMDFEAAQRGDTNYVSTTRDVRRLIKELKTEGIDGLVMDLRNNGGGSLTEAVDLTGLFIKDGPVVQVRNSANEVRVQIDEDQAVGYRGPLVVLTNRFSASASEIFAGAIQDYNRGVIVGESTYGKGTVQSVIDLKKYIADKDDVGELKITFQKFYRVSGSSTQHKGVTPDISLPSALNPEQYGESANPSALKWDVIQSAAYQKNTDVNAKIIARLNKSYQDRLKFDPELKKYVSETEDVKKNLKDTKISLNEVTRKREIAEAEKKKGLYEKLDTKLGAKEGLPVNSLQKLDDEYLRESLLILNELISKDRVVGKN